MRIALIFYNKLVADLEAYGFTIKPYDPCVVNKMVNGKQLTVMWHMDDLKISHVDSKVVTGLIDYLQSIYGKMHGLRKRKHDYPGMWLDYSKDRKVEIIMEQFLCDVISEFFEEISKTTQTPASAHIFEVRDESDRVILDDKRYQSFHRSVVQLSFACARCRKTYRPLWPS